jgi:MYXO-CTERM domain-containing protein
MATRASLRAWSTAVVFMATGLASREALAANTVNFCDFSNLTQIANEMQVNGETVINGREIHLTPNSTNTSGSAYFKQPIPLDANTSFSTHFRFRIYPNTGATGGSGFTFLLQNKSLSAVGGSGGGLGFNGVGSSVAVEFDTSQDSWDTNGNHVAVIANGNKNNHLAQATPAFSLKDGSLIDAWIDYNGATNLMSVFVASGSTTKPGAPLLTYTIDVVASTGTQAWVGFTGATGASDTNNQDVTFWSFNGNGNALADCNPCVTDAQCVATPATPACQASGFCGQCSATNQTACTGSTPVCITSIGECGGCLTNANCSGNTPVCNTTTHLCAPCTGDGAAGGCTNPAFPACQTSGPLAGSCTECSATNGTQCTAGGPTPTCLPTVGVCGCTTNAVCGPNQICNGQPPACTPGCITGTKDCTGGLTCTVQDGGIGVCTAPCTGNVDCPTNPNRVCKNPGAAGTCVQCLGDPDCTAFGANLVCNLTTNTCGECSPTNGTTCTTSGNGSVCRPNDTCGCNTDTDCGNVESGRVCDDTAKVCTAGCRGNGGNGCAPGDVCTSTDGTIGSCGPVGDGGVRDGGVTDGSVGDGSVGDGGVGDGGSKDGSTDGSAGDGGVTDGSFPDGAPHGDGSVGGDSGEGDAANDGNYGSSIEGGGCSCSTQQSSQSMPVGGLLALGAAVTLLSRRRKKK